MRTYSHPDEKDVLRVLKANWPELWPVVRTALEARCDSTDRRDVLKLPKWIAWAGRIAPDEYKGDEAKYGFRIQMMGEWPVWDFFINGVTLVHCQPVW